MSWFGHSWGAPICANEEHVPTPVGKKCFRCDEPILEGERGILMQVLRGGDDGPSYEPLHIECHMRGIIGSVGHQRGKCHCFGGTEEDPPSLTVRQAAQAALDYYESKRMPN